MNQYPHYTTAQIIINIWNAHLWLISGNVICNYTGGSIGINRNDFNTPYEVKSDSYITQGQRDKLFGWSRTKNVKMYRQMLESGLLVQLWNRGNEISHFCLNTETIKEALCYSVEYWHGLGVPKYEFSVDRVVTVPKPNNFEYLKHNLYEQLKEKFHIPNLDIGIE